MRIDFLYNTISVQKIPLSLKDNKGITSSLLSSATKEDIRHEKNKRHR